VHEELARLNFGRDIARLTPLFVKSRNWTLNQVQFPILDVTFDGANPLRIRLICDSWDELPPAEQLLTVDGKPWGGPLTASIFHPDGHSVHHGPFVCMRGFRGYHTHSSHLTDAWSNYRDPEGNNLPGLLDQLSRAWRRNVGR
jgi:hypothetical protein